MIGLPFANAGSAELQEKIKYARQKGSSSSADAGKEYYENMCMRGVNQSIGKSYMGGGKIFGERCTMRRLCHFLFRSCHSTQG